MKPYSNTISPKSILMLLSNPFEPDPRVYKEAKSLVENGYQVEVLAWDRTAQWPATETIEGIKITRIQCKGTYGGGLRSIKRFLVFYWQLIIHTKAITPWAIHCHDLDTAIIGWIIKNILKIKMFVYDAHEPDYYGHFPKPIKFFFDKFEAFLSRRANAVFITNNKQEEKFKRLQISHTIILRNVPDLMNNKTREIKLRARRKVIGRIGYIKPGIGLENLLEAVASIQGHLLDLQVVFVGKVFEPYKEDFEMLLNRYKSIVEYRGFVPYPDVLNNYLDFSISYIAYDAKPEFWLSSPTKLFESMAFGVPVIVSPIGDVQEILHKYPCGVVIKKIHPTEISEAIIKILGDNGAWQKFSEIGQRGFEQEFNWQIMEKRLLQFYGSLT